MLSSTTDSRRCESNAARPGPPDAIEFAALRELVEQAPCGYVTCTQDGMITWANETFLGWTGYALENLVGTDLARLFPVGDRILWATSCLPQLNATGAVAEVLLEIIAADRVRRAVLISATRQQAAAAGQPQVRIIVFGAHERRRHERDLLEALRRAQDSERQRAAAEDEMRRLAVLDPLTGLANRRALTELLTATLDGSATPRVAVLVLDLDHFKAVNDSLGHAAGDELLTVLAQRLVATVRDEGTIARLGGDEFVIVVAVDDDKQAAAVAQRLLDALAVPVVIQELELVVSASIGYARAAPGERAEQVLHHADVAMYRAKARGGDALEAHDPHAADPAADRLRTLGELRRGIENGELRVHYQPRVDLRDGRVSGVEALVRWQHPERGLLAPGEFVDLAESSGLIHRLGRRVLEEALAQGARWVAEGRRIEMAVNLCARQLSDPDLATMVGGMLTRHGLDPALLTLEVTETALMTDPDAAALTLTRLKALGVTLAIDDFGTGYASFTYLQRFPLDELKIDRSFVSSMQENPGDATIVAICVRLAHSLGLRSVAEGVETRDQRDALIELGCDQAQGFWFSRPVPPEQLNLSPIHGTRTPPTQLPRGDASGVPEDRPAGQDRS